MEQPQFHPTLHARTHAKLCVLPSLVIIVVSSMENSLAGNTVLTRVKLKINRQCSRNIHCQWTKHQTDGGWNATGWVNHVTPPLPSPPFFLLHFRASSLHGRSRSVRQSVLLDNGTSARRRRTTPRARSANGALRRSSTRHAVGAKSSLLCGLSGKVNARRTEELHLWQYIYISQ